MTTTDVLMGGRHPDAYDQLLAYARFAGTVQDAAERAATLPELQDALRGALAELNATLNPEEATTE